MWLIGLAGGVFLAYLALCWIAQTVAALLAAPGLALAAAAPVINGRHGGAPRLASRRAY
jgi:hypothetical protein